MGTGLTGNGNHRSMVKIGIGHPRDQVGSTRPKRSDTYTGFARQATVNIGHKSRTLLMSGGNELDRGIQQRIHDIEIFLTWNAKDVFHTFVFQAPHKELSGLHLRLLFETDKSLRLVKICFVMALGAIIPAKRVICLNWIPSL
jgi:hypothetical protein